MLNNTLSERVACLSVVLIKRQSAGTMDTQPRSAGMLAALFWLRLLFLLAEQHYLWYLCCHVHTACPCVQLHSHQL